ncbi:hypothetical protein J3T78_11590 [Staphylococcus nepalensis]|uniref:Uncharacterized protein n=1 Tax=Staphylococcus nepalensis TaxID=214473 RepID=A0ABS3L4L3_9STAP|nr:hypothetical protein [Staphylococcus nepalensis]MBO1213045.1 hypothetical protein [Staphylococcus nepalensis]MBO1217148.1 hypothetical protein [Staphylococcus nepalensis]MBO1227965.1 hypothetical protein [Staphylococcus nepalensis]MBO1235802.1 hypothetical protein [Staphylococcus nepalensis]MBO1238347.1 hypothetical protein [Staphylococcus nepalensis]
MSYTVLSPIKQNYALGFDEKKNTIILKPLYSDSNVGIAKSDGLTNSKVNYKNGLLTSRVFKNFKDNDGINIVLNNRESSFVANSRDIGVITVIKEEFIGFGIQVDKVKDKGAGLKELVDIAKNKRSLSVQCYASTLGMDGTTIGNIDKIELISVNTK